jgi:hypothetical protein
MRNGAQPFSQTHNLIAEIFPKLRLGNCRRYSSSAKE